MEVGSLGQRGQPRAKASVPIPVVFGCKICSWTVILLFGSFVFFILRCVFTVLPDSVWIPLQGLNFCILLK